MANGRDFETAGGEQHQLAPEQSSEFDSLRDFFLKVVDGRAVPHDHAIYRHPPDCDTTSSVAYRRVEMSAGDSRVTICSIDTSTGALLWIASNDDTEEANNFLAILGPNGDGLFMPNAQPALDCSPGQRTNRYRAHDALQELQITLMRLCYIQKTAAPLPLGIIPLPILPIAAHAAPNPQSAHVEPTGPYTFAPPLPGFEEQ